MTSPQILYPDEGRRLTVILAADIFGYSALMGQDELRTVHDLKGHQAVVTSCETDSPDASSTPLSALMSFGSISA